MAKVEIYHNEELIKTFTHARIEATDEQCIIYTNPPTFLQTIRICKKMNAVRIIYNTVILDYPAGLSIHATPGKY